jgi:hypothetical protein
MTGKSMDKIVSLKDRIEHKQKRIQRERYRGKIGTLKKIIQCSSCQHKCAMCGLQIDEGRSPTVPHPPIGMMLCECCRDEFEDFLSSTRGKKRNDIFWHNQEWKKMWSAWLNYRKAINEFTDSPEFRLLLEEMRCD